MWDDLNLQLHQVDMNFAELNKSKDFIQDPKTKKFSPRCHYGSIRIFWKCEFMGWILGYSEVKFMLEKYIISGTHPDVPRHFNETQSKMAMSHFKDIEHSTCK